MKSQNTKQEILKTKTTKENFKIVILKSIFEMIQLFVL